MLESCVKNCGAPFHAEIASKSFMEELRELIKVTTDQKVRDEVLKLIQAWAHAFRSDPSYRTVQDTVNLMKIEGFKFPVLKESDAMFAADSAPEWADGECCHRCRVQFSMVQRKHHCRNCGQIFCGKCSSKQSTIPRYGIEKEVRVCEDCYDKLNKSMKHESHKASGSVESSPYQAVKTQAPGKSEQEIQEEEELQLALALSQSEAESKERERSRSSMTKHHHSKHAHAKLENIKAYPVNDIGEDSELSRYLNRDYWEQRASYFQNDDSTNVNPTPSAPQPQPVMNATPILKTRLMDVKENDKFQNGSADEMETFLTTLRSALEIFVNRMNSNQLRGRSIANDSAVQSLFLNITNMHSQLIKYIQQQDEGRTHFENLQDKLNQIRDARAALDALREEHQEQLKREAEEAERIRQQQMSQKLEIMRKKKQEYLQYQREMALQRIQEQEREMLMRQANEHQKYVWQAQNTPTVYPQSPPQATNAVYQAPQLQQTLPGAVATQAPSMLHQVPPMQQHPAPATVAAIPQYQTNSQNYLPQGSVPSYANQVFNMNSMANALPGIPTNSMPNIPPAMTTPVHTFETVSSSHVQPGPMTTVAEPSQTVQQQQPKTEVIEAPLISFD